MKQVPFLFPGQGAQYVGMGKALFDRHASVQRLFEEASDTAHKDLKQLCFEGPEAVLVQTDNAQPAITLVNLSCLTVLQEEGVSPAVTAGHSLGEYSALCAAGVLTFGETIRLVSIRGAAMQESAERHPGAMTAVFGLDMPSLEAICAEVAPTGSVEIASQNSPQQIVIAGEKAALQQAAELAKKKGAKLVVPLKVAGPWHTRFMADARDRLRPVLTACAIAPPAIRVMANATGVPFPADRDGIVTLLLNQLVNPVLWATAMRTLVDEGSRVFVEAGPGKALSGFVREISREVMALNVQDEDSLALFRTRFAALQA
jgi:[acyl-carrier-protein] S-malonyltransferase